MSGHRRVLEADRSIGKWWRPQPVPEQRIACTDPYRGPHNRCRHATARPARQPALRGRPGVPVHAARRLTETGVRLA